MKRIPTIFAAAIAALPLLAAAQTANQPGGQASTGTPLEQTDKSGNTTPRTTQTSPDATNPAGTLPPKGTTPAASTTTSDGAMASPKTGRRTTKSNDTKTGDVPTYPAPAPDGTPTK